MASATLQTASSKFPVATTVGAYPLRYKGAGGGGPTGPVTDTAAVASNGTLTFNDLVAGVSYTAYAEVSGEHRYLDFGANPSAADLDPATFWASDQEVRDAVVAAVVAESPYIDLSQEPYNVVADNSGGATATANHAAITQAMTDALVPISGLSGNDVPRRIILLPPGRTQVDEAIDHLSNCLFTGHGQSGSYLVRAAGGVNGCAVRMYTGVQQTLADMGIVLTADTLDGVDVAVNAGPSLMDSRTVLRDLVIVAGRDGVHGVVSVPPDNLAGNANELRISRVTAIRSGRHGFVLNTTDYFVDNCTAAESGESATYTGSSTYGFSIGGANSRIWGCKAFGQQGSFGAGFGIGGARHQISACEAQDCEAEGFNVTGGQPNALVACLADSCGTYGFEVQIQHLLSGCTAVNRGGLYTMKAAVYAPNGATVKGMRTDSIRRLANDGAGTSQASYNVGIYDIDNRFGAQAPAYAATVTPDPWEGQDIVVGTLTGPITLANPATSTDSGTAYFPSGMLLRFQLTQDGTGGRDITFGAKYKLVGGGSTITGEAASAVRHIEFRHDGTNWREQFRAVT